MGRWGKNFHNQSFHGLYSPSNIIYVVSSRRVRYTGYVTHLERKETCTGFWLGNLKERDHLEDLGIDEMIILHIQGDSGGICTTLGIDSMSDSKQKSSYERGSDFERLRSYDRLKLGIEGNDYWQWTEENNKLA